MPLYAPYPQPVGVGFSLNPMKIVKSAVKAAESAVETVVAPVKSVVNAASDVVKSATSVVAKVPVLGPAASIVSRTAFAPLAVANSIASGARLDHVAVGALKEQIRLAKDSAPYAQAVVSFVPGVGTGAAAAIAAGSALAEGQSITAATKAAVRGALPGAPLSTAVFDTATKLVEGKDLDQALIESARNATPAHLRPAFDVGIAIATGEKIQTALADGLKNMSPEQALGILAVGQRAIASTPALAGVVNSLQGPARDGATAAAGLLATAGMNEKALVAVRNTMATAVREGFDAMLRAQLSNVTWLQNVLEAPVAYTPPKLAAVDPSRVPHTPPKLTAVTPRAAPPAPPMAVPAPPVTVPQIRAMLPRAGGSVAPATPAAGAAPVPPSAGAAAPLSRPYAPYR